jgi:hypothetical protein
MGCCFSSRTWSRRGTASTSRPSKQGPGAPLYDQFELPIEDCCVLAAFSMAVHAHAEYADAGDVLSLPWLLEQCQRAGMYTSNDHEGIEFDELIDVVGPSLRGACSMTSLPELVMEQGSFGAASSEDAAEGHLRALLERGPVVVACYVGFDMDVKYGRSKRRSRACEKTGRVASETAEAPAAQPLPRAGSTAAAVAAGDDVPHAATVCGIDAQRRVEVLDSFGMIDGGGPGRYLLPFDRFDATWKYCPDGEDTASKREWLQPRPNPAAAAAAGDKDPTEAAMPHNMFAGEAAAAICS